MTLRYLFAAAAVAATMMAASAQIAPTGSNWEFGADAGVATPMHHAAFFGDMRAIVGAHLSRQITPAVDLGGEVLAGINTSRWPSRLHSATAFDDIYLGAFARLGLNPCCTGPFGLALHLGAGWGHRPGIGSVPGAGYVGVRTGIDLTWRISRKLVLGLQPSVLWAVSGGNLQGTSTAFDKNRATLQLLASVRFAPGGMGFECIRPYDPTEVLELNTQVNTLRRELDACSTQSAAQVAAWETKFRTTVAELEAQRNRPAEQVVEVATPSPYGTVRFVFFGPSSSTVSSDQMPNVQMIAEYMRNHPTATVLIKGYASPEGSTEINDRLASQRAAAVATLLTTRYGIDSSRITAEGAGVGNVFPEPTWNRVSVCTLEDK